MVLNVALYGLIPDDEVNAPLDELVRRVRARGGPDAEALASNVLLQQSSKFVNPTPEEIARFDRYIGPDDVWKS